MRRSSSPVHVRVIYKHHFLQQTKMLMLESQGFGERIKREGKSFPNIFTAIWYSSEGVIFHFHSFRVEFPLAEQIFFEFEAVLEEATATRD